ncbi:hypothetical protein Tco_0698383 [Tanacetum coccineum]
MVAPAISISSDTSEESVGSHAPRVILFGVIPAIIPEVPIVPADLIVAPDVGAVSVVSPTRVLDLVDYSSSSDSDPSEDSLPPVPDLALVSPFLCTDDSEADDESEPAEQRPERHESLTIHDAEVSRLRDKVVSRPSSPSGPSSHDILASSSEFPLAPIVAPPGIRRRKRVRPLPARILLWRRVSHHSSDHHSSLESSSFGLPSDSLSDPSLVHSSGCDSSGQAHSGPSTRDVSPRLVYPPVLTPRYSEAFRRWRAAPLSTPYPPTTLESSLGSSSKRSLDSSSHSSGPSRKRCRSPTASAIADLGISDGVRAPTKDGLGMGVEIVASDVREDEEEFEAEASEASTIEIAIDPLANEDISESTRGDVPDHGTADGAVDITYETL